MAHNKRKQLRELHLFAGAGGGILGGMLCGHRTVCAVEIEKYPREVLLQRQRDGILPEFPIWDDVRTFDGKPWRGKVDVVCGGFPCQDISCAGKGAGIDGERSGMWGEMARIIGEIRPQYAFVENSPMLVGRGLARVLGDLAEMGYDARWGIVSAADCGAPHIRERIWIVAKRSDLFSYSNNHRIGRRQQFAESIEKKDAEFTNTNGTHGKGDELAKRSQQRYPNPGLFSWWESEPGMDRVANGVDHWANRLKAIGNGQVPAVAALAWRILTNTNNNEP